jgi:hypothetical protein
MIKAQAAISLVALLGSISTWAEEKNGIGATLRLLSENSDNALRTSVDEFSERQDSASADLAALYENDFLALNSRYSVSNNHYAEDSQEDRTSVLGSSEFRLGKSYQLAELVISHSSEKVLSSAGLINLDQNNDERQTLVVQPILHTSNDSANVFFVQGNATEVNYRFDELRNSSRQGFVGGWQHAFTAVDTLSLSATQTDVEFDALPEVNYKMRVVTLNYSAKLRRLQYLLEVGHSSTDSEAGRDQSEPYYRVEANFENGYNQYRLTASQKISDSSFGAGVSGFDQSPPGEMGDVGSINQEQMLVRLAEASWTTAVLCSRCELSLQLTSDDREYLDSLRHEELLSANLGVTYLLSNAARLGVKLNRREQSFARIASESRSDFTLDGVSMFYEYRFANGISTRLIASQNEQTSDDLARVYKEGRVGMVVTYRFK